MNEAKSPMRIPRGMEREESLNDGERAENIGSDGECGVQRVEERSI
jgi:hypothetical protein